MIRRRQLAPDVEQITGELELPAQLPLVTMVRLHSVGRPISEQVEFRDGRVDYRLIDDETGRIISRSTMRL